LANNGYLVARRLLFGDAIESILIPMGELGMHAGN